MRRNTGRRLAALALVAILGGRAKASPCGSVPDGRAPGGASSAAFMVYGTVRGVNGSTLTVATSGRALDIDVAGARASGRLYPVAAGTPVAVLAMRRADGGLAAQSVARAKATARRCD